MESSAPLALLLLGLGAIIWGTQIVVENAIAVARHHRVSDFFIGVVVLAVGSDLPELVISVDAAFRQLAGSDTAGLIVGNAIGSCFGQLGLVLGIGGLLGRLSLPHDQLIRHGTILLISISLLTVTGFDGEVGRLEGAALVIAFCAYFYFVLHEEGLVTGVRGLEADEERAGGGVFRNWLRLLLGIIAVVFSAELIVRMAMELAVHWGVAQSVIGITIVGVGTSLPEVVISIGAVLRGRLGLSVGNLLGSNILDTLLPIGLAALVVPLEFSRSILAFHIPVLAGLTLLGLVFLWTRGGIRRSQAAIMLAAYGGYLLMIAGHL